MALANPIAREILPPFATGAEILSALLKALATCCPCADELAFTPALVDELLFEEIGDNAKAPPTTCFKSGSFISLTVSLSLSISKRKRIIVGLSQPQCTSSLA
jgi:hypothetical protein